VLENENIEFKENYSESIYKDNIAFLNSKGGTIYIDYNDKSVLIGLDKACSK